MIPSIVDMHVLSVQFENQGGDWVVKIPGAFKDGTDFVAPITEEVSLQFQPVVMRQALGNDTRNGVACVPLNFHEEKEKSENETK